MAFVTSFIIRSRVAQKNKNWVSWGGAFGRVSCKISSQSHHFFHPSNARMCLIFDNVKESARNRELRVRCKVPLVLGRMAQQSDLQVSLGFLFLPFTFNLWTVPRTTAEPSHVRASLVDLLIARILTQCHDGTRHGWSAPEPSEGHYHTSSQVDWFWKISSTWWKFITTCIGINESLPQSAE